MFAWRVFGDGSLFHRGRRSPDARHVGFGPVEQLLLPPHLGTWPTRRIYSDLVFTFNTDDIAVGTTSQTHAFQLALGLVNPGFRPQDPSFRRGTHYSPNLVE